MLRMVVLLLMFSGTALAASGTARLPDDARLAPVRVLPPGRPVPRAAAAETRRQPARQLERLSQVLRPTISYLRSRRRQSAHSFRSEDGAD